MRGPMRWTGNWSDSLFGPGDYVEHITFHELLAKKEGAFISDPGFMQIPKYVQVIQDMPEIEEDSRQAVVEAIIRQYDERLIAMQNYVRWAKLFQNRCEDLTPAFWAQVNMISTMNADELELDENTTERRNMGESDTKSLSKNAQKTLTENEGKRSTTTNQITESLPVSASSSIEASATMVRDENALADDLDYAWSKGADSVHEVKTTASASKVLITTDGANNFVIDATKGKTTSFGANSSVGKSTNTGISVETSKLTNKQFMQERRLAVETARDIRPLLWLFSQLDDCFYGVW